jgi:tetratricopeptide (TPR) repeat protein
MIGKLPSITEGNVLSEDETLHQKALDIYRKALGEEHPHTARSYHNVAFNLNAQGKYAEAGPLYQKALDNCRKTLGEEYALGGSRP